MNPLLRCWRLILWVGLGWACHAAPLPRLQISENHRFLVTAEGQPFFWLADTAWELFHRLSIEESTAYLENRAAKWVNVVQAVALAEFD